jgi:hypothetical protein
VTIIKSPDPGTAARGSHIPFEIEALEKIFLSLQKRSDGYSVMDHVEGMRLGAE